MTVQHEFPSDPGRLRLSLSTDLRRQATEKGQGVTTADEADKKARLERAREAGLFRYSLVQELLEPGLSAAERGWRARELAGARP